MQDILKGALTAGADAGATQDFRAVSLKVGGSTASPKVSDLQVESKAPAEGEKPPTPEKKVLPLPEVLEVLPEVILPGGGKPSPLPEEGPPPAGAEPTEAPSLEDAIKGALLDTIFK